MSFSTHLKRVKALGSAKSGVDAWWAQRKTALVLIPLVVWFCWTILLFMVDQEKAVIGLLYSPFKFLCFLLLLNISLYHGMLGIKEICEDYIHHEFAKILVIFLVQCLAWLTMLASTGILILNFIANIG